MASGSFWKGMTVGVAAGVAASMAVTHWQRSGTGGVDSWRMGYGESDRPADSTGLRLKRDENAGDPRRLTSARTGATPTFERRGGAPGPGRVAESSETPGWSDQRIDYTDLSKPVKPSSRTLDLGTEGGSPD